MSMEALKAPETSQKITTVEELFLCLTGNLKTFNKKLSGLTTLKLLELYSSVKDLTPKELSQHITSVTNFDKQKLIVLKAIEEKLAEKDPFFDTPETRHKAEGGDTSVLNDIINTLKEYFGNPENSDNIINYINKWVEKELPVIPTPILEKLLKSLDTLGNADKMLYGNIFTTAIKEQLTNRSKSHPESWIENGQWYKGLGKGGFGKKGFESKFLYNIKVAPLDTLQEWQRNSEEKAKMLAESNYSQHPHIQNVISFLEYEIKAIQTEIKNKESGNTLGEEKAGILVGINNIDQNKVLGYIETLADQIVEQDKHMYISKILKYYESARELQQEFRKIGKPANLAMSPLRFVEKLEKLVKTKYDNKSMPKTA